METVNEGNKGQSVTKNIFLYPLHFKEKVGVNKWNWYMLVCIIPYWDGCSFLIQCNPCLEEKYRVEVFIADLFFLIVSLVILLCALLSEGSLTADFRARKKSL